MIVDFVMGKHAAPNYMQTIYIRRMEMGDDGLDSLYKVANLIYTELNEAWKNVQALPYDIDTMMRTLSQLISSLEKGQVTDSGSYRRLREILSLFAVKNYEIYVIKRLDLQTAAYSPGTKAYLIDKNDDLYPTLNRVCAGYGINFPDDGTATLPTVVFTFLKSILNLDEVTKELITLKALTEQYEALNKVQASYQMPIDNLMRFLSDYGYHFEICING